MKSTFLIFILFLISCSTTTEDILLVECNEDSYSINLDGSKCTVDIANTLSVQSTYLETNESALKHIEFNNIPNHKVGQFPNKGNPNTIKEVQSNVDVPQTPSIATSTKSGQSFVFGVLFSGVTLDPYTAEYFKQTNGQFNKNWNYAALTNAVNLGLDCNNGHVQPNGKYHYHGSPSAYLATLDTNGTSMVKIGFAADGFPIYYKYAYINDSITTLKSGYQLKEGERPGDGNSAPNGCYDGTYVQDYEYVTDLSPLDQCNGMLGKTPDSDEEYFYVVTDNYPSAPMCFKGTPNPTFKIGPAALHHNPLASY